jgi:hypothetical protein
MELHDRPKRKPRTYDRYQTMLKKHVIPAIGSKRISTVTRGDVVKLHAALSATPGGLDRNPERNCERF